MKTESKVAWITGGASGIGAATARLFVQNGMRVLISDLNEEKGAPLVQELGENALFVKTDVTESEQLTAAVNAALDKWGRMDVVVNCAGCSSGDPFFFMGQFVEEGTPGYEVFPDPFGSFKRSVAVNTIAPYDVTRHAVKYMAKNEPDEYNDRGCIIYISSGAATKLSTLSGVSIGYPASKASQLGLMLAGAQNMGDVGIRAVAVLPGLFDTGMVPDFMQNKCPPVNNLHPKVIGDPALIASMCLEVVRNPFVNQTTITVDAGWHVVKDTAPD